MNPKSTRKSKPKSGVRRQRPLGHGRSRMPLPSCVLDRIHEKVTAIAVRHNVSRSFVIAATLADAFGIKEQERYDE